MWLCRGVVVPALADVTPPFTSDGTHSVLQKRDQEEALLAFKLRCCEEDKLELQEQLAREVSAQARASDAKKGVSTADPAVITVRSRRVGAPSRSLVR